MLQLVFHGLDGSLIGATDEIMNPEKPKKVKLPISLDSSAKAVHAEKRPFQFLRTTLTFLWYDKLGNEPINLAVWWTAEIVAFAIMEQVGIFSSTTAIKSRMGPTSPTCCSQNVKQKTVWQEWLNILKPNTLFSHKSMLLHPLEGRSVYLLFYAQRWGEVLIRCQCRQWIMNRLICWSTGSWYYYWIHEQVYYFLHILSEDISFSSLFWTSTFFLI